MSTGSQPKKHRGLPDLRSPTEAPAPEDTDLNGTHRQRSRDSISRFSYPYDLSSHLRLLLLEEPVEVAGEVALEAAVCFAAALAVADSSIDVGDRRGVSSSARDEDHVQGAVESSVAAAVEAVADRLSRGGGKRCAAGEAREGGLASDPAGVRPGDDQLGGDDRRVAVPSRQPRAGESARSA